MLSIRPYNSENCLEISILDPYLFKSSFIEKPTDKFTPASEEI